MNSYETLINLLDTSLPLDRFKFCLVNENKLPFNLNGKCVKINNINDFISFESLIHFNKLEKYAGIGISIQGSNISAIDVDKCFSIPFDINSADDRALDIIQMFIDYAYIEFSFSGTGLRILFTQNITIDNTKFYIKNEKNKIEYYQQCSNSFRYVTITGKKIVDNNINEFIDSSVLLQFVNKYMKKEVKEKNYQFFSDENKSFDELMKDVKKLYLKNYIFQEAWFNNAPGSNSNESERDFLLLSLLYENITQDKEKLKKIFECSPYFLSKDIKHINKWKYNNNRYYNYVYERLK